MKNFVVRTTVTGIIVLIPVFFAGYVLTKFFFIGQKLAKPIVATLEVEKLIGVIMVYVLAIVLLFLLCFLLGVITYYSKIGQRAERLDQAFSSRVPGYAMLKGIVGGVVQDEASAENARSVVINHFGVSQLGILVEETPDGGIVAFVPNVPNPQTGQAFAVKAGDYKIIDVPTHKLIEMLQFYGKGMGKYTD